MLPKWQTRALTKTSWIEISYSAIFCGPFILSYWESSTRRNELFFTPKENASREALYQYLLTQSSDTVAAMKSLQKLFDKYPTNQALLDSFGV